MSTPSPAESRWSPHRPRRTALGQYPVDWPYTRLGYDRAFHKEKNTRAEWALLRRMAPPQAASAGDGDGAGRRRYLAGRRCSWSLLASDAVHSRLTRRTSLALRDLTGLAGCCLVRRRYRCSRTRSQVLLAEKSGLQALVPDAADEPIAQHFVQYPRTAGEFARPG